MARRFSSFGSILAALALGAGMARAQTIQYITLDDTGHFVQDGVNSTYLYGADIDAQVGGSGITGSNTTASFSTTTSGDPTYTLTPSSNGLEYDSSQYGSNSVALSHYAGAGNFVVNGTTFPTLSLPSSVSLAPNIPIISVKNSSGTNLGTYTNAGNQNAVLDIVSGQNLVISTNNIGANYKSGSALINLGFSGTGGTLAMVSSSNGPSPFTAQSESFTINASQLVVGQEYDVNVEFDIAVDSSTTSIATEATPDSTTLSGAIAVANLARNSDLHIMIVSSVPEPSTYALIAGVVILGVAAVSRRRAKLA